MDQNSLGAKGEAVAAAYYRKQGYVLLEHNYRTRLGELDLILLRMEMEPGKNELVFAEVKTRKEGSLLRGAAAVDIHKQRRLIAAAQQYLAESPFADSRMRFDVVEVTPDEGSWKVHCIRNAFELG